MATYSGGNYCARWHDILPQRALGNALGEEAAELREHLESCAACRRELALLEEALALMPLGLEPLAPSAATRARLFEQVQTEASGMPWGVAVPIHGHGGHGGHGPAAHGRARGGAAQQAAASAGRASGRGWLALALAASFCAAAGAGVFAVRTQRQLRERDREIAAARTALREAEERAEDRARQLQEAEERLRLFSAQSMQVVALREAAGGEGVAGRIFWDQDRQVWYFVALRLPPAPADRDYQLWFLLRTEGGPQPVSAGLLTVGRGGQIEGRVAVPRDIGEIGAAAVTLERKGGAEKPTSDPILVGDL
jgi:hypothetical protein